MGWYGTFEEYSSESIKAEFTREGIYGEGRRVTDAVWTSPGTLWGIMRDADGQPLEIILWLVSRDKRRGEWAYKPVEETMGPAETSCPLRLLDACPGPWAPGGIGPARPNSCDAWSYDWRARVRAYWAGRAQRVGAARAVRRDLRVGGSVRLRPGLVAGGINAGDAVMDVVAVSPRKRGRGGIIVDWPSVGRVRVKASYIGEVIS